MCTCIDFGWSMYWAQPGVTKLSGRSRRSPDFGRKLNEDRLLNVPPESYGIRLVLLKPAQVAKAHLPLLSRLKGPIASILRPLHSSPINILVLIVKIRYPWINTKIMINSWLSRLPTASFRSGPRSVRMLCEGRGSLGEGFFDYSAGVPRDGVLKTWFWTEICSFLMKSTQLECKIWKWIENGSQN